MRRWGAAYPTYQAAKAVYKESLARIQIELRGIKTITNWCGDKILNAAVDLKANARGKNQKGRGRGQTAELHFQMIWVRRVELHKYFGEFWKLRSRVFSACWWSSWEH